MLSNIEDMRWKEPTPIQMQVTAYPHHMHDVDVYAIFHTVLLTMIYTIHYMRARLFSL
jgi:hypothetical protein